MVQSVSNILSNQLKSPSDEPKMAPMSGSSQHPQHYLKLCVLGAHGVGKSAVIVRYLTRRFIGEYRSQVDITYHHIVTIQNQRTFIEICDFSPKFDEEFHVEEVWGDCHLIVFSIADHKSFLRALSIARSLQQSPLNAYPQMTLLGNKLDLEHSRQVSLEEATKAAQIIPCQYAEVSVAESREDIVPIIRELLLRTIYQQEGEGGSSCFFSALNPSPPYSKSSDTDKDYINLNKQRDKSPMDNDRTSCSRTLPRDLSYNENSNKLPKTLCRSFSCKQNSRNGNKWQDRINIHGSVSENENKVFNGFLRNDSKSRMNKDERNIRTIRRNNSHKSRFLNGNKIVSSQETGDKKFPRNESNPLSLFSRGRSNTLNGLGKNGKRPLELRPSVDVLHQDKRNAKSRKPNSRFLTLVSPFGCPESRQEDSFYSGSSNFLESSDTTTCITRMVVQSDKIGSRGFLGDDKPPFYKGRTERSGHLLPCLPNTEDKTSSQNSSRRKFGVFGISSLGSVFSKGSLPDLPKATASLYTKIGSIKNTIKKRSV